MPLRYFLFCFIVLASLKVSAQTKKPAPKPTSKGTVSSKFVTGPSPIAYIYEDLVLDKSLAVKALDEKIAKLQEAKLAIYNDHAIKYQTLYLEYQNSLKNIDTMTTEKLNAKLKEVQDKKKVAEDFQRDAEKEVQELMGSGIQGIRVELDKAVKEVAALKKYPIVLRRNKNAKLFTQGQVVLSAVDGGRHDLTEAVILNLNAKK